MIRHYNISPETQTTVGTRHYNISPETQTTVGTRHYNISPETQATVDPLLSVFLDCPSVFSNVYSLCIIVSCTHCGLCFWIVPQFFLMFIRYVFTTALFFYRFSSLVKMCVTSRFIFNHLTFSTEIGLKD
jgi:hypothetical protein